MYAVIRTGGKQYRVAPGDVIRVEKLAPAQDDEVQFGEVLAVSSSEGQVSRPSGDSRVLGRVIGEGRADKVLVFHYKRKKQYKKMQGHRQPFTAVQITEISVGGQTFRAENSSLRPGLSSRPQTQAETEEAAPARKRTPKGVATAASSVSVATDTGTGTARPKAAAKKAAKKPTARSSAKKK